MTHKQSDKIVVFSGAGMSAESGLPTFRDADGLWRRYDWRELASAQGWQRHPREVLEFYNERRRRAWTAEPNAGHLAIASLEAAYRVVVITQNVDALHERAGSSQVIHIHGELAYARGTSPARHRYRVDGRAIEWGQCCEDGTQLRPDVVWFGEPIQHFEFARSHVAEAQRFLVVGTSLTVFPAALLAEAAHRSAKKVLLVLDDRQPVPAGFVRQLGRAAQLLPELANAWLREAGEST